MLETFLNMIQDIDYKNAMFFYALLAFIIILISGKIFKEIFFPRFSKFLEKHHFNNSVILTKEVREMTSFWFILLGVYFAFLIYPIKDIYLLFINKLLLVGYILSFTVLLINISSIFLNYYGHKKNNLFKKTTIIDTVLKIIIFAFGGMVIMQSLGISIVPILTALGVGGLAIALALQETLSNFFAGFHILASKQVSPGDYIKLDTGEEGYVVDITWRNTTIRSRKNNSYVIPNSKMSSAIITNYYQPQKELSFTISIGVSYESDLEKVEKITIDTAREVMQQVPGGIPNFEPVIRYHTFGDFSVNFNVVLRATEFTNQYILKHEFIKKIHKKYQQENINIPYPIRTIYNK